MTIYLTQIIWNTDKDRGSESYLYNDDRVALDKYEELISDINSYDDRFVCEAFDINGEPNKNYFLEEHTADEDDAIDYGKYWLLRNTENNYFICVEMKALEVE